MIKTQLLIRGVLLYAVFINISLSAQVELKYATTQYCSEEDKGNCTSQPHFDGSGGTTKKRLTTPSWVFFL